MADGYSAMHLTENKPKLAQGRIRWPYYGWFLLALPVVFIAATAIAFLVAATKFKGHGESKDLPAVLVTVETGPPRPEEVPLPAYSSYAVAGQPEERHGGFGPSGNYPRQMPAADAIGMLGKLSVVVASDQTARVGEFSGLYVRVVNRSAQRVFFSALDSQLYLVQEAMNDNGEWQSIEEPPNSTGPPYCGNSYHRISLKPGECRELVAPCYGGPLRTKLRFRLDLGKSDGGPGGKIIYSNAFDGSIQREQFQRSNAL